MADFTANFEAGINGNTITTGAGEASATAWNAVAGSPVYDNAHVAHGSLAGKFPAAGDYIRWDYSNATDHYGRVYLWTSGFPAGDTNVVSVFNDNDGLGAAIWVQIDGKMKIGDAPVLGGHQLISTATISTSQWIRFEYHVVHSTTVGQVEAKLFNTADSSTPTETVTSPASWYTHADADNVYLGFSGGTSWPGAIWLDDLVANATSYPGPAIILPPPTEFHPQVSGWGAA